MNVKKIINAWKDEDYRLQLTGDEVAMLPESPVGVAELSDSDLELVGGATSETWYSKRVLSGRYRVYMQRLLLDGQLQEQDYDLHSVDTRSGYPTCVASPWRAPARRDSGCPSASAECLQTCS